MDSLLLRNIRVNTRIGVPDEERKALQDLLVSIEFLHPIVAAAKTDNPAFGIDYAVVVQLIEKAAMTERKTLERFAEDVTDALLRQFKP
ncbi:MAG: dihydroneopterin aldolase, partial [Candidatus Peribacteraceae bacterium]|nr:dihydroneopterin aldolase [Candidatus Peribacteraceae bacterium]